MQSKVREFESINISKNDDINQKVDLTLFMNQGAFNVLSSSPLSKIYRIYRGLGIRHLTIVNTDNEVEGIITRGDLCSHFTQDLT